jgi:hypothetical protein
VCLPPRFFTEVGRVVVERCADYATPLGNVNEAEQRNTGVIGNLSCTAICALHNDRC